VALDAGDDAGVRGDLGVPAAGDGVVADRPHAEDGDVGQLGLELGDELRGGDVVVALLADVGVGAGLGGELAGAVAVRDAGLEHLGAQPSDPAGDDGLAGRGDGQGQRVRALAHRLFVGGADGRGGQRGVAQGHLGGDEQGHQRLQRHARVDQGCRICVPELQDS
jgi:hypothetical protein